MARFTKLTEEQRRAIYEEYLNRDIPVTEIAERYKIAKAGVMQIAIAQGAEPRNPKKMGKRGKVKKCPNCHRTVEVKGAKFCCFCGADMRSKRELLIERVEKAIGLVQFLPTSRARRYATVVI